MNSREKETEIERDGPGGGRGRRDTVQCLLASFWDKTKTQNVIKNATLNETALINKSIN